MEDNALLQEVMAKAQGWLDGHYDEETKREVRRMMEADDKTELIESFYKDLEFGTGGLRGIMGVGSNRMNIYTVGAATQGLSNYLKAQFPDVPQISVVIGHDCRNNSRKFAEISANIFSANGIKVYLFDDLRPTPEASFAIRHLGCQSGIILTASHNPKEYNGYKAYWSDGAQMIAPHDVNVIKEVEKIKNVGDIKFRDLDNALQCAQAMIKAAEPGHMSFKLRLGLNEENKPWLDVALRLEDMGAGLVTLHPRTAKQGFSGEARWEELALARERLSIPVLASGDLFTAEDGMRCLDDTGVDGVMYARGALTNPGIFAEHNALAAGHELPERNRKELKAMISRHMALISSLGNEENAIFRLRSIVPRYVRTLPGIRRLRQELCQCTSLAQLDTLLDEFLGQE